MFINKIIKSNLKLFHADNIINMRDMLYGFSLLKELNLNNFNITFNFKKKLKIK